MIKLMTLTLSVAVVFVNGWTDAPNAIASAVSTGAMKYRSAAFTAGMFNLLGLLLSMGFTGAPVAETVAGLANFGEDPTHATAALCAVMSAIVIFAVTAWRFGIPTSESHALIAGMTGASLALGGGVGLGAWAKVLAGLAASVACGYGFGFGLCRLLGARLSRMNANLLKRAQIFSACGMAFTHGAQDGQKFVAVFILSDMMAKGVYNGGTIRLSGHMGAAVLCALTMALGACVGGNRIVRMVGEKMVKLRGSEGVCADLGGAACLIAASLLGIPMSTTHTKTTAMMGAASAGGSNRLDASAVRKMASAWAVTFPACGALGYVLTGLYLWLIRAG